MGHSESRRPISCLGMSKRNFIGESYSAALTPQISQSHFNRKNDSEQWHSKFIERDTLPSCILRSPFEDQENTIPSNMHLSESSRYSIRPSLKHERVHSRRRKINKSNSILGDDKQDISQLGAGSMSNPHRIQRPKTAIGLQSISTAHPRRGIGRVGVQVLINDCVCIASSADLGTAIESKNELTNKRHVLTWASRMPSEPRINETLMQPQESDSGTQIDVVSTPQESSQSNQCNCSCQPAQSAADYYHSMQSRQSTIPELAEKNKHHLSVPSLHDLRGDMDSQVENEDPSPSYINERDHFIPSSNVGHKPVTNSVSLRKTRKKFKQPIYNLEDPHKLYPDPLRWGGERPFRWEDSLRATHDTALIVAHPQKWIPVGKQHYSRYHSYPSWPQAITSMIAPCYDIPQPRQTMICWPDPNQLGSTLTCCPVSLRNCSCGNSGSNTYPQCQPYPQPNAGYHQTCPC